MLVACRQDDPAVANPTWAYGGSVGVRLRQPGLPSACPPALVAARAAFVRSLMILRSRSASAAYRCSRKG